MNKGWIKLHRSLLDWQWMSDPYAVQLFVYLILSAQHEDRVWKHGVIHRGEVVIGTLTLASHLKCPRQILRTRLGWLEEAGTITTRATNRYTIITICNYDEYQDKAQLANQLANQPITTIQEYKKNKEEKNYTFDTYSPLTPQGGEKP